MRRWRGAALIAAGLVLAAGCSADTNGSSGNGAGAAAPGSAPVAQGLAADGAAGNSTAGDSTGRDSAAAPGSTPALKLPQLIRTAELTVAVDEVSRQAQRAAQLAADADGQVFSDQRTSGDSPTADLVLKVPPADLGPTLDKLAGLGTEEDRHTSAEDVSEQVADVDSRVSSAKASLARLRTLYDRAGSISEVAALEAQISQRESDLESLQARQRALGAQVATATITLHLHARGAAPAATGASHPTGFLSALRAGWHALALSFGWLLTVLGAVLPFAVPVAALGYAAHRLRRRNRPAAPEAAA
jgi:uncharacterized protein DUF4349